MASAGIDESVTKIIEELISTLNIDASVRDIRVGLFPTGALSRNCGLSSTLPRDVPSQNLCGDPWSLGDQSLKKTKE